MWNFWSFMIANEISKNLMGIFDKQKQKALGHITCTIFYNYNIECQRSIETPGRCAMSCQWSIPVVRLVLFAHVEKK